MRISDWSSDVCSSDLFPSSYQLASPYLAEDSIIRVKGSLSKDKDQPEIRAQEVSLPDISEGPNGPVVISLPSTRCTADRKSGVSGKSVSVGVDLGGRRRI